MPDDIRENLVLMDIEAINSLYTDNLKAAFDNAQRAMVKVSGISSFLDAGMCKYDVENPPRETPPEGAGWVIELRGSTYHKRRPAIYPRYAGAQSYGQWPAEAAVGATAGAAPAVPAAPATPPEGQPAPVRRPDDEEAMLNAVVKDRAPLGIPVYLCRRR